MTWQPPFSMVVYWVAALLLAGTIWLARRVALTPRLRSWWILGLRACVLGLLLVILLNPIEQRETHLPPEPASVAILVDTSRSMALGRPATRLDEARQLLHRAVSRVPSPQRPRIELFRFGLHLAKVPGIADLRASDDASLLAPALERLPARFERQPPQTVVVMSDGAFSDSAEISELGAAYRELGVPLHTMAIGEASLRGDVGIQELAIPGRVTEGDRATLRTVIHSRGFDGQRVVATVRAADRPELPPLATLPITLKEGRQNLELVVEADPDVGRMVLELPELSGESIAENNRIPFRLNHRDRRLNVLYLEGTQNSEYRWLRDALQEDSDIRCDCLVVNNQYAQRPRLQQVENSYLGFPTTRKALFDYDVVICSDISQAAFTPEQIAWTVELVADRGGGFVMIGGHTSFGAGGWDRTEWEKLIPFDMTGQRNYVAGIFQVEIPADSFEHPIWKIVDEPEENRRVLAQMPQFFGTNLIAREKPAATILGRVDRSLPQAVPGMPVFASQAFGRGRTFAMSTDTTADWGRMFESRWGEGGDNRYYRKFWRNVIRWLAENSQASQRRLFISTDQVIYPVDAPIHVTAEAFDEQLRATTKYRLEARLDFPGKAESAAGSAASDPSASDPSASDPSDPAASSDGGVPAVELAPEGDRDHYVGEVAARFPAEDRRAVEAAQLVVTAWEGDEQVARATREIQLLDRSPEWLDPVTRPETLEKLAAAGGGKRLQSVEELTTLLSGYEPAPGEVLVHKVPRWDHPALWGLILALLSAEWMLRRRGRQSAA